MDTHYFLLIGPIHFLPVHFTHRTTNNKWHHYTVMLRNKSLIDTFPCFLSTQNQKGTKALTLVTTFFLFEPQITIITGPIPFVCACERSGIKTKGKGSGFSSNHNYCLFGSINVGTCFQDLLRPGYKIYANSLLRIALILQPRITTVSF